MTRENLIFLGACTIMSSSPYSTMHATGRALTGAEAKLILDRAIDWSTALYTIVHRQTAVPAPAEEGWEVQVRLARGEWTRSKSTGINSTFSSYKSAYEAMERYKSRNYYRYRIHQIS